MPLILRIVQASIFGQHSLARRADVRA